MHERRYSGGVDRLRSAERVERLEVEQVIQLCLEDGTFGSVLDVGTGSGLFAEGYSKRGLEVTGIDVNDEMLHAAMNYVPLGSYLQATAEELPFSQGSFDLTFFGLILHEADDALRVLQGAHFVSRGRVCVLEWPYQEQTFGPPISDRLSPARLEELFDQAGFTHWEGIRLKNTVLYRLDCQGGNYFDPG